MRCGCISPEFEERGKGISGGGEVQWKGIFVPAEPGGRILYLSGLKATITGKPGLLTGLSE